MKQRKRIIGTDIVDASTTCVNTSEPQLMLDSMPSATNSTNIILYKADTKIWTEFAKSIEWFYATFINVNGRKRAYIREDDHLKISYRYWEDAVEARNSVNSKFHDNQVIYSTPDDYYHLGHPRSRWPYFFSMCSSIMESIEVISSFRECLKEDHINLSSKDYYLCPQNNETISDIFRRSR